MKALSDWLYRCSSWQTIIVAIFIYGLFMSAVMIPHAEEMRSFAGDWGAPDGHLFYTPDELYAEVSKWGDAGRSNYINFRLGLDPLWALAYTSFLITITSVALRRATPTDDRRRVLNLLPLIPMCADLAENALGIALMSVYPTELNWLAWLTAVTSCFKWLTLALAHVLAVYALIIGTRAVCARPTG
jgi:hypothetical protein